MSLQINNLKSYINSDYCLKCLRLSNIDFARYKRFFSVIYCDLLSIDQLPSKKPKVKYCFGIKF